MPVSAPRSLPAFLGERLARRPAVVLGERHGDGAGTLTGPELLERAAAIAAALRGRGIGPGDRVALVAENSAAWLVADLGILAAGAVVVPLFATTAADQVAYVLADSGAALAIVQNAAIAATIRDASGPAAPALVVIEEPPGDDASLGALLAEGAGAAYAPPPAGDDDLAVLIYTSGTTGTPKGVMLSHGNLLSCVGAAYDPVESGMHPGDVALTVLPLAHIYAHANALGYAANGLEHWVTTPDRLLDDLRALRPHQIAFVPRIFERLLGAIVEKARSGGGVRGKLVPWALEVGTAYERARLDGPPPTPVMRAQHALADRLVLRKLRPLLGLDRASYVVSGSAPLHRDIALTFAALGIVVCEGYGLTETSPVVTVNRPGAIKLGTVGTPVRGVQIRIADDGEVLVKGPNVMRGYLGLDPAAQPFTADGWLQTGDVGTIDEDGYLRITDRKREIFKSSGGKWISPARIETAVARSLYVAQAVAVGANRPHPACLVVPNWDLVRRELAIPAGFPSETLAARDDVRALIVAEITGATADLAPFERVRRVAVLPRDLTVESGELSPSLKVRRRVVEERYAAFIETAYAEDLHARPSTGSG